MKQYITAIATALQFTVTGGVLLEHDPAVRPWICFLGNSHMCAGIPKRHRHKHDHAVGGKSRHQRACTGTTSWPVTTETCNMQYMVAGIHPKDLRSASAAYLIGTVRVGLYHTPFFGYLILGLGSQNHKVRYPKKGYGMSLQVVGYRTWHQICLIWCLWTKPRGLELQLSVPPLGCC